MTPEVSDLVQRILNEEDWSFARLVEVAGLDPKIDLRHCDLRDLDLCGEDLRGFDLTGADLRGCKINELTIIDDSTILVDAITDWDTSGRQPVHSKMHQIDVAGGSEKRRLLEQLVAEYSSPRHIHQFLRSSIARAKSPSTFFDLLDFFQPRNSYDVRMICERLIDMSLAQVQKTGKKSAVPYSAVSFSSLVKRLSESRNATVMEVYQRYLKKSDDVGRVSLNPNKYEVSDDLKRLIAASQDVAGDEQLATGL